MLSTLKTLLPLKAVKLLIIYLSSAWSPAPAAAAAAAAAAGGWDYIPSDFPVTGNRVPSPDGSVTAPFWFYNSYWKYH